MSPLFCPSGLIYRYVLQSPDRSAQDLKILEDWVLERKYRSIQGVADDSGLGGPTMQYQVQLDPNRLFSYGVSVRRSPRSSAPTTRMRAAASTRRAASSSTSAGSARSEDLEDIGNIVVASHNGIPVYVKDVGQRRDRPRAAPRPVRLHAARTTRSRA